MPRPMCHLLEHVLHRAPVARGVEGDMKVLTSASRQPPQCAATGCAGRVLRPEVEMESKIRSDELAAATKIRCVHGRRFPGGNLRIFESSILKKLGVYVRFTSVPCLIGRRGATISSRPRKAPLSQPCPAAAPRPAAPSRRAAAAPPPAPPRRCAASVAQRSS